MTHRHISRREVLRLAGSGFGLALLPRTLFAAAPAGTDLQAGLADSDLVYVTPLHGDGRESTCQAEVWFVEDAGGACIVTAHDAWRARAVRAGLSRARIWVGDVGVWGDSEGAYRGLPEALADATLIADAAEHERVLEKFGDKYTLEWVLWGPRFHKGLEEGSRVMIRYQPRA